MKDNKSKPRSTKAGPKTKPAPKKQILPVRPKGRVINEERNVPPRKDES